MFPDDIPFVMNRNMVFPAQLTDRHLGTGDDSATYLYSWTEQFYNTAGQFEDGNPSPRQGDDTIQAATEVNNRRVNVPCYVWLRLAHAQGGADQRYEFLAPEEGLWAKITAQDTTPTFTVTQFSLTSNVATVQVSSSLTITSGVVVNLASNAASYLNGTRTTTSVTGTSFTFALTHANVGLTSDTGTVTPTVPASGACAWQETIPSDSGTLTIVTGGKSGTFTATYPGPYASDSPAFNVDSFPFTHFPTYVWLRPGVNHIGADTLGPVTGQEWLYWWNPGDDSVGSGGGSSSFSLYMSDGSTADSTTTSASITLVGDVGTTVTRTGTGGNDTFTISSGVLYTEGVNTTTSISTSGLTTSIVVTATNDDSYAPGSASHNFGGLTYGVTGTAGALSFTAGGTGTAGLAGSVQINWGDGRLWGSNYIYFTDLTPLGGGHLIIDGSHSAGGQALISLYGLVQPLPDPSLVPSINFVTVGSDTAAYVTGRLDNNSGSNIEFGVDAAVDDGNSYTALKAGALSYLVKVGTRVDGGDALAFYGGSSDGIVRQPTVTGDVAGNAALLQLLQALGQGDGSATLKGVNLIVNSTTDSGLPDAGDVSFSSAHGSSPANVADALDAIWVALNGLIPPAPPW